MTGWLNPLELAALLAAWAATAAWLRFRGRGWRESWGWSSLLLPFFALSLHECSQFLTTDELYIVMEPLEPVASRHLQWSSGFFHTTLVLLGVPLRLLAGAGVSLPMLKGTAKLLHWLLGFLSLLLIEDVAESLFAPKEGRRSGPRFNGVFFGLFLGFALLLPMNQVALRTFNYDLLALTLAALGYLLAVRAWLRGDALDALRAVVVSALGAQEKISASPMLFAAIVAFCLVRTRARRSCEAGAFLRDSLIAQLWACGVFLVTFLLMGATVPGSFPPMTGGLFFYPLTGWFLPLILSFSSGGTGALDAPLWTVPVVLLLPGVVAWIGARLALLEKLDRFDRSWGRALVAALVGLAALGIYGIYGITPWWSPHHPIGAGLYQPTGSFNGNTIHFGAVTAAGHRLSYLAWCCALFVCSTPSIVWPGVILLALPLRERETKPPVRSWLRLTALLSLLGPLAFGALLMPAGNRYFQIPLFMLAAAAVVEMLRTVPRLLPWLKPAGCAAILLALLLCETLPFGPLYGSFRPVWLNFGETYDRTPVVGQLNPSWIGWGEEAMIAGKRIAARCGSEAPGGNCGQVRLWCPYPGDWVFPAPGFEMHCTNPWWEKNLSFTDHDYYILSRASIVQSGKSPAGLKPWLTLEFRGFVQAWVYRGDQLAGTGYTLN